MLRKFLRAGPSAWVAMLEAQVWIAWAHLLVRTKQRGKLLTRGAPTESDIPKRDPDPRVDRAVVAIRRVSKFGILRPQCLVRSIALHRMLCFHGVAGAFVRFGVRTRDGEFESHAWVEYDGWVIGDDVRHVRTFSLLDELIISTPPGP